MRKLYTALAAATAVLAASFVVAQPITKNYMEQGGASWVVGGALTVPSGGTFDLKSGATFKADACLVPVSVLLNAQTTDLQLFFVADRAYKIMALTARVQTAAGSGVTAAIEKAATTVAVGSATAVQTGTFNLNSAGATVQDGVVTAAAATLAADTALLINLSAGIGSTVGVITICLAPV